jgi:biotin operon repressor
MTDEEKDQFVARYNVAKGGRIGFQEGSKDAKSSVEFTREELGLGPLKINQEIDKLLKEGVDIEIIKSMTGAPDELIQERIRFFKYGGAKVPLKKAKGGVMSIPVRKNSAGVKELDMRKSGGFVPIGVKEKADDVPAMLSLNEFVMTADAVRGAGDGNVKKGAQRMYDTMKKLESRVG